MDVTTVIDAGAGVGVGVEEKEGVDTGPIEDVEVTRIVVGACDEGVGVDICCEVMESMLVVV